MSIENPNYMFPSRDQLYLNRLADPFPNLCKYSSVSILLIGDAHFPSSNPVSKRMVRWGSFPFMGRLIDNGYRQSCDELVVSTWLIDSLKPDLVVDLGDHDADLATLSDRVYTAENVFRPAFTGSRTPQMIFVPGNHDADNLPAFLNTFFNFGMQFGYQRIGSEWLLVFTDTNFLSQDNVEKMSHRYCSGSIYGPNGISALDQYFKLLSVDCRGDSEKVMASVRSNQSVMKLGKFQVSELLKELYERQKILTGRALELAGDEERKIIAVGHDMKELVRLFSKHRRRNSAVRVLVAGHRHLNAKVPSLNGFNGLVRYYVSGADPFFPRSFSLLTLSGCEYKVDRLKTNTDFRDCI